MATTVPSWQQARRLNTGNLHDQKLCHHQRNLSPAALVALASLAALVSVAFCRLGAGVPPSASPPFLALPASAFFLALGLGVGFPPPSSMAPGSPASAYRQHQFGPSAGGAVEACPRSNRIYNAIAASM